MKGECEMSESEIDLITLSSFLETVKEQLTQHGFDADSTIAVIATCRDELCQPLIHQVRKEWGEAFDLNGLAGLPIGGITALTAASHHAPSVGGRRRVLLIGMPHIALGESGAWGDASRQKGVGPSRACGALDRLCGEKEMFTGGEIPESMDDDVEYGVLRNRMWSSASQSLRETTIQMAIQIRHDLLKLAEKVLHPEEFDYAVFTGIFTHLSDGSNMIEMLSSDISVQ